MTFGRRIVDASSQGRLRCAHEFINRTGVRSTVYAFQNLKQAPSLALVTFGVQDAFPFEVDVIHKGETSSWRSPHALELLLYVCSIGRRCFIQHFRQRAL